MVLSLHESLGCPADACNPNHQRQCDRTPDAGSRSMPGRAQLRTEQGESCTLSSRHRRARAPAQAASARPRVVGAASSTSRFALASVAPSLRSGTFPMRGSGITGSVTEDAAPRRVEFGRGGSDPVVLERARRRAARRHPDRSTPAARSSVAGATIPSGSHAVDVERSGPNPCPWRSGRAGRDVPADGAEAVAPWRSARTAAKAPAGAMRRTRDAPPARARVRPGEHAACHYPAGGRVRNGAKRVVTGGTSGLAASGGKGRANRKAREALVTRWYGAATTELPPAAWSADADVGAARRNPVPLSRSIAMSCGQTPRHRHDGPLRTGGGLAQAKRRGGCRAGPLGVHAATGEPPGY